MISLIPKGHNRFTITSSQWNKTNEEWGEAVYQRYFGPSQKSRYALAYKAGIIGLAGTFIVFFSFLYNLYMDGEMTYFYCNAAIFSVMTVLLITMLAITKREPVISISKSNYILFLGFLMLSYYLVYGIQMYFAFHPALFSIEFFTIFLHLFLNLLSAVLLLTSGLRTYRELQGRYTRMQRRLWWKRFCTCGAGMLLGILAGFLIVI